MSKGKKPRRLVRRVIRAVLITVLGVALVGLFYLSVILGQPQEGDQVVARQDQPLLPASPAVNIAGEGEMATLLQDFPVPVMSFVTGAGPALASGTSGDTAFEDGFARVVTLTYALEDGGQVVVRSIYPARALTLVGRKGYVLNSASSVSLAGLNAVRMEGQGTVRFHAQSADALYELTVPAMSGEELSELTKALQLVTVKKDE